jgi:integrase
MPLTLYRRTKNGIYRYRGTIGPAGRRKFFDGSCKTTDKAIAARQVAEIEARYWKGNFDGPGAVLTFAEAAKLYRAAGKSGRFLDNVEGYLGSTLVKDINPGIIKQMALTLYPGLSGASLNRLALGPATAVINFCAESELCLPIRVKRFKFETKEKEPATLEWVMDFMAASPDNPHLAAYPLFMFLTGARPGEATALQWADVDLKTRKATIRQSKVEKAGGIVERKAHLPRMLVVALANLPRIEGRGVFVYKSPDDLAWSWKGVIKRAGIKRLTPHCCRHGFATGLLRRGVDVVTIAKLGGWTSPAQVFATYGHANDDPTLTDLLTTAESVLIDKTNSENPHETGTT